jgi:uncharacterized protein (DUF433 family)
MRFLWLNEEAVEAILERGVYSISQAAKLVGLRPSRVREWFRGRSTSKSRRPVFQSDYEPIDDIFAISFYDLVDVYVAGQLREHGVSLQTLRRVYKKLASDMKERHPFCRKELLTDGQEIFVRGTTQDEEEQIYEVLTKQMVFPKIILPFLRTIDYDNVTILASRWRIAQGVVIDPRISFGRPVVKDEAIPTYILYAEYKANCDDFEKVATWYNISPETVKAAVSFESGLLSA